MASRLSEIHARPRSARDAGIAAIMAVAIEISIAMLRKAAEAVSSENENRWQAASRVHVDNMRPGYLMSQSWGGPPGWSDVPRSWGKSIK